MNKEFLGIHLPPHTQTQKASPSKQGETNKK